MWWPWERKTESESLQQLNCEEIDGKIIEYLNSSDLIKQALARKKKIPEIQIPLEYDDYMLMDHIRERFTSITGLSIRFTTVNQCAGYLLQLGFEKEDLADLREIYIWPGTDYRYSLNTILGQELEIWCSEDPKQIEWHRIGEAKLEQFYIIRSYVLNQLLIRKKVMTINLELRRLQALKRQGEKK